MLKDVFISRAGIAPKTTSDDLFADSSDSEKENDEDSLFGDVEESFSDDEDFATPAKKKSRTSSTTPRKSTSKKTPKKSCKAGSKKATGTSASGDAFDLAITALVRDTLRRNKMRDELGKAERIAALAEQFKRTTDALGSRIEAAYHCAEFEQFLTAEEKPQFAEYKVDMDKLGKL